MSRTTFLAGLLTAVLSISVGAAEPRMIVLGVDGMDPGLLGQMMRAGQLPNLARLAGKDRFIPLGTSIPPQSPVAWSNFITGMDPGGHGLFDFLALDRDTLRPYLSSVRIEPARIAPLAVGRWRIPLGSETVKRQRRGRAFWELLDEAGVTTTIVRIPANYPPVPTGGQSRALSGMGTPDLRGTPGTFTYYTTNPDRMAGTVAGGEIRRVILNRGRIRTDIQGPPNPFLADRPPSRRRFEIQVDPEHSVASIDIEGERVLINEGEWTAWIQVTFELVPGVITVPGMVRFYLQSTHPQFALYASPVNVDPRDPAQPIAHPQSYVEQLAAEVGPFYTQEMPEDTKALSAGVLDVTEFLDQSALVLDERQAMLRRALTEFRDGDGARFLFFYFSSVDQRHHMLYRYTDAEHPHHAADAPLEVVEAMHRTYREIDEIVGWIGAELGPDTALVVMSDHGFAPFRHQVHLNAWLERNGYLHLLDPTRREEYRWLEGIDWAHTRAFAVGLNSLYLNVRGRERHGVVESRDRQSLAREVAAALAAWRDPSSGEPVVTQAVLREDVYHGPHVAQAPDIVVGYARGYRASWATTVGATPGRTLEPNRLEWSGDHCIDSREVPGVLVSSLPVRSGDARLQDLTASIFDYFGIPTPDQVQGNSLF